LVNKNNEEINFPLQFSQISKRRQRILSISPIAGSILVTTFFMMWLGGIGAQFFHIDPEASIISQANGLIFVVLLLAVFSLCFILGWLLLSAIAIWALLKGESQSLHNAALIMRLRIFPRSWSE